MSDYREVYLEEKIDYNSSKFEMMRILFTFTALTMATYVNAQPVTCIEDVQCSDGFYCDSTKNMCYGCLICEDLNRDPVPILFPLKSTDCVKSCGACFKGLVTTYTEDWVSKCVPPAALSSHVYMIAWFTTAAAMGALLLIIFVWSLLNMDKFKIVVHSSLQQLPGRRSNDRAIPDADAVSPVKSASAA